MKALVMDAYTHVEYKEVPQPTIQQSKDVLINIKASAICGSDVHGYDGSTGRRIPPIIMGHEASGVVQEIGNEVTACKVGERVTFDSTIWCGYCHYCRSGQVNLCDNRRVLGVSCDEYRQDGTFAEYVVVPEHIIYKIANEVSFTEASLTEPAAVAAHAINITPIKMHDSIAVVGSGLIGLLVIQIVKSQTSGSVIAIDTIESRRMSAIKAGADAAFDPSDPLFEQKVKEYVGLKGVDRVFEAVGATKPIQSALSIVRKGGSITLIGNVSPTIELPLQKVVTREISLYGSCAISGEYEMVLDMMAKKKINVLQLVSVEAPLSEGKRWFDTLYNKTEDLLKVVLIP